MQSEKTLSLTDAIKTHQSRFDLELTDEQISFQENFYRIVMEQNDVLHLVAPGTPEDFAVRHILESIFVTKFVSKGSYISDVGTGAGLPSIPCLLFREDLRADLVESKNKKAVYLENAVNELGLQSRGKIINKQFSEIKPGRANVVTCRAIDKFSNVLPLLIKWAKGKELILMAGPSIIERLQEMKIKFVQHLIPMSEQRFILIIKPKL